MNSSFPSYIVPFLVTESILTVVKKHISHKEAVKRTIIKYGWEKDILLSRIVTGKVVWILRRKIYLDYLLECSFRDEGKDFNKLSDRMRILLDYFLYERMFRGNIKAYGDVERCIIEKYPHLRSFLPIIKGAVLTAIRKKDFYIDKIEDPEKRFCIRNSFPYRLYTIIKEQHGKKIARKFVAATMKDLPYYIRVNLIKTDPDRLRKSLEEKGFVLEETEFFDVFKVLKAPIPLVRTEEWKQGYFRIQDKASCAVVHLLNPQPGEKILDLCAAPGSKTSHIASLMNNKGEIIAVDISRERVERMRRDLKRYGITNVKILVADARKVNIHADKVLVDPSCTSTGTLNRYPEIKIFSDFLLQNLKGLVRVQREILENAVHLGSVVVYSVCSVLKDEGENNTEGFNKKIEKRYWNFKDKTCCFYMTLIE